MMTSAPSNGGPRFVVAGDATKRVPPAGSDECEPNGGPRFVVAGDDEARPSRKAPAHHSICEVFNRSIIVFVTVCSKDKRHLFGTGDIHDLLVNVWREADAWLVGSYVVMPDHIHMFCTPGQNDYPSVSKWIQYWKALASRKWPRPGEHPVWQKSFWDTQLRRGESYAEKWEYVKNNPVRAGLCAVADEWPLQGEMNRLIWHD